MTGAFHTFKTQTEISRKAELKECEARVTSALKTEKENEKRDLGKIFNFHLFISKTVQGIIQDEIFLKKKLLLL